MLAAAEVHLGKESSAAAAALKHGVPRENITYYINTWRNAGISDEIAVQLLPALTVGGGGAVAGSGGAPAADPAATANESNSAYVPLTALAPLSSLACLGDGNGYNKSGLCWKDYKAAYKWTGCVPFTRKVYWDLKAEEERAAPAAASGDSVAAINPMALLKFAKCFAGGRGNTLDFDSDGEEGGGGGSSDDSDDDGAPTRARAGSITSADLWTKPLTSDECRDLIVEKKRKKEEEEAEKQARKDARMEKQAETRAELVALSVQVKQKLEGKGVELSSVTADAIKFLKVQELASLLVAKDPTAKPTGSKAAHIDAVVHAYARS